MTTTSGFARSGEMGDTAAIGIDVGGTKCLGVVVEAGEVVAESRCPTPDSPGAIIDTLVEMVHELGDLDSVGVGVPGLVTRSGVIRASPNLTDVADFDVAGLLSRRLSRGVTVENDATCAAIAEWKLGAAKGFDDAVVVTLGTGIGGGLIVGGRVVRGHNGFAGEVGHMVVDPNGPVCPCGRRGCWERFASGSALGAMARSAIRAGGLKQLGSMVTDVSEVRGEHVCELAESGDSQAREIIDEFAHWAAIGLVGLTNILDPACIVIGGGLARSHQTMMEPVRRHFGELLYSSDLRPHPRLEIARFGEVAGALGAAIAAMSLDND
ncbi:MAG: ROK family protein [Ilumatobacteraceae bacterium]